MEPFRCPTCIGLLPDANVRRCPSCGQSLRRRRPHVLGEDTRLGSATLPVDRWMLDRLDAGGTRRGRKLSPVAWHGRFTTASLAEPDIAPTAAPIAAVYAFDAYTDAVATITETEAPVVPEPEPTPESEWEPESEPEPEPELLAPPAPLPSHSPWPQPMHEELDPDVRALIDELYEHARAELSGEEIGFFAPVGDAPDSESPVNERLVDEVVGEPPFTAPQAAPQAEAGPEQRVNEPRPDAPAAPNASSDKRPERAKSGWVAAIQTRDLRQRPRG